jgi:hypothetical protein
MLVSGGGLRGPALATLSLRLEDGNDGTEEFAAVVSEHVPRTLSPPALRALRGHSLLLRLVEHPVGGTLDELLARRARLAAGEGATLLAAVARGLADLHACGRAGARLTPRDVGFRDDGCPILTGVRLLRPLSEEAARADVKAYALLATTVCTTVSAEAGAALLAAATGAQHRGWEDVIRAVLGAADPIAVEWRPAPLPVLARSPSAGSMRRDGPRDVDVTIHRGEVRRAVSASKRRAGVPRPPRRDSPPSSGRKGGRRTATSEVIPRVPATHDSLVPSAMAPALDSRPRREPPSASVGGRDPAGNDRVLRAVERLLDGIGDRPVVRVMRGVRAWAAARPPVVAVAVVPAVGVLLALALIPPGEQGVDVVGKNSSAPLRASGTGPNGCELLAESRNACDG